MIVSLYKHTNITLDLENKELNINLINSNQGVWNGQLYKNGIRYISWNDTGTYRLCKKKSYADDWVILTNSGDGSQKLVHKLNKIFKR